MPDLKSIAVIIPTLNAGSYWANLPQSLKDQGINPQQVLIVDSQSDDGTAEKARLEGFQVQEIARTQFNHGGTRQWALQFFPKAEIAVYLTQDAIPATPDALKTLLAAFEDPQVAAAFGRQLPRRTAGAIESHARSFNYPDSSETRTLASRDTLGFKTIFLSNSFAAYRRSVLEDVGGFPANVIMGEDTIVAARFLLKGWNIAYVAEAAVYHSHPYSGAEEFKRYFDTGVLHSRDPWLMQEFGGTGGQGSLFVRSELSYLAKHNPALIPLAMWRTAMKLAGYRLGRIESKLSPSMKKRFSMHHRFWSESPK